MYKTPDAKGFPMSTSQLGGAVHVSAENLHRQHHAEIVVFTRDGDGPGAFGVIYNTLGLADDVSDEEFDTRFRALDPKDVKKDFGDVVWLNGPRRALMDRMTLTVFEDAKVSMAGPIPMRTVATVRVPDPDNTVGRLAALGERLSLPAGWEYRVLTLEQDLVVRADAKGGPAHIVLDEYKGNYQRIDNA